jgi:Alginate export
MTYSIEDVDAERLYVGLAKMDTIFCLIRFLVVFIVVGLCSIGAAGQQSSSTAPPAYLVPRYDEDWTPLKDPSRRREFWDSIKYIPIGSRDGWYASVGGEARETYERFHNPDFGDSPQDPNGYWLQRLLVHGDLHFGPSVRIFADVVSGLEFGRNGGPRPFVDRDKLDLHQAFIDFRLAPHSPRSPVLRVGRQEIGFGSSRMVAFREGTNVSSSFDGARLTWLLEKWTMDAFATKPVATTPGIFDDKPQHSNTFWGLYSTRRLSTPSSTSVDLYYLGLDRKSARFDQGVAREIRHTLGARFWGHQKAWNYDDESMFQFGEFGGGEIRAWRVATDTSYTFASATWRPAPGFVADVASGDHDPNQPDLQTFNALFQSGVYSGKAGILGPANEIRLEPYCNLHLSERISTSAGWGFFWRESLGDGLYDIAGNLRRSGRLNQARYQGNRAISGLKWQVDRHLSMEMQYMYVFNGPFTRPSSTASLSYVGVWGTYRF